MKPGLSSFLYDQKQRLKKERREGRGEWRKEEERSEGELKGREGGKGVEREEGDTNLYFFDLFPIVLGLKKEKRKKKKKKKKKD